MRASRFTSCTATGHTPGMKKLLSVVLLIWFPHGLAAEPGVVSESLYQMTDSSMLLSSIRAQLRPKQHTTLSAGLPARITYLKVMQGETVKQGETLAKFDCRRLSADRQVIQARLRAAEAKQKINLRLLELQDISELELAESEAEVAIAKGELAGIRAVLGNCSIKAPFSGMVTEKLVQAHQHVAEGEPMLKLVDTKTLEVEMVLPSQWLSRLKTGDTFTLMLDELGQEIEAKVDRVVGEVDPVSQTVKVIGRLLSKHEQLLPGMSGTVSFK